MDRATYNECMKPHMTGSKTKQQRQHDMCVGAKLCSGKATSTEEAEAICNQPKLPKWAKSLVPKGEEDITCQERKKRSLEAIEVINLKVRSGEAEEVIDIGARVLNDLIACKTDSSVFSLANEAMTDLHDLSKRHYLKGEAKDLENKLNLCREVIA